ncbi:hypothetical protein DPMN_031197 [Dreissena polymorpha]|uniref:Uncharacterized protein n=1 Tax=Dreissena polymorpha TaxID=45954 RepID=A0A9D4M456_DREPO|nr:hypothetical protein DPMN_031197 [Dreissena polymorpha]
MNYQQYGQLGRLSQTQELPRGRVNQLRSSTESLPTFASSKESRIGKGQGHIPENDLDQQSNPSRHGSRDNLDSDYQSSVEINQNSVDFHGNVYPLPGNQFQGQLSRQASQSDLLSDHSLSDRENVLRRSIEDFHKFKEAYREFQGQAAHLPETGYYANGDIQPMPSHQHYHAAEHPYDQGHYAHFHNPDHITAHPMHHHGYDEHYHGNAHHEAHHHFRNIYTDRPYHMIGDREEAEGGNVVDSMGYYHHNYQNHGYHAGGHIDQSDQGIPNYNSQAFQSADQGFFSHNNEKTAVETTVLPTQTSVKSTTQPSQSAPSGRKLPQVTYRLQNVSNDAHKDQNKNMNIVAQSKSRDKSVEGKDKVSEGIALKVKYDRDSGGKRESERSDRESSEQTVETEFMEQGLCALSYMLFSAFPRNLFRRPGGGFGRGVPSLR